MAKKIFELKIEACPVNAGLLLLIQLETLVAFDSESCQRSFPFFGT